VPWTAQKWIPRAIDFSDTTVAKDQAGRSFKKRQKRVTILRQWVRFAAWRVWVLKWVHVNTAC